MNLKTIAISNILFFLLCWTTIDCAAQKKYDSTRCVYVEKVEHKLHKDKIERHYFYAGTRVKIEVIEGDSIKKYSGIIKSISDRQVFFKGDTIKIADIKSIRCQNGKTTSKICLATVAACTIAGILVDATYKPDYDETGYDLNNYSYDYKIYAIVGVGFVSAVIGGISAILSLTWKEYNVKDGWMIEYKSKKIGK